MKTAILAIAAAAIALTTPMPALAQDDSTIIVTGSRVERDDYDEYYDDDQSAIGLTRQADYFVKPILVSSDSRDSDTRRAEVTAMLQATIARAEAQGINLVAGRYRLRTLNAETLEDLTYGRGSRPDTTQVQIYARLPVGGRFDRVEDVDELVSEFTKDIPVTGRSYIETRSTVLAIDNPQSYRGAVVEAIADESKRYAAMFGPGYGVEVRGLDSELYFKQASETEVFLYIRHTFIIRPPGRGS